MKIIQSIRKLFTPAIEIRPLEGRHYPTSKEAVEAFNSYKLFQVVGNNKSNNKNKYVNKADLRGRLVLLSYGPNKKEMIKN